MLERFAVVAQNHHIGTQAVHPFFRPVLSTLS
jgi:hypothetical protein